MYKSFKLNKDFVESFREKKPKFGFNGVGEFTFFRTYSRIKKDGKNEQYFETVQRVVNTVYSIQKEWIIQNRLYWNEEKAQRSAEEMYRRIFEFKFTPAGRGFWALVPELLEAKGGMALHNCFDGDVEFMTDKGLKKLRDCDNTYVNVLNRDGKFCSAKVTNHGKQSLNTVVLKPYGLRSNLELKFNATSNHRWILADGSVTEELKVGDVVVSNPLSCDVDKSSEDYINGFTHGLIFGDGTKSNKYPQRHYIKICDGEVETYRPILSTHKGFVSETSGKDSYPYFTIISEIDLKSLPKEDSNPTYLKAFIEGWMSADAYLKYKSNTWSLDTQNKDAADWIIKNAGYGGFSVTGISVDNRETNYGKRKNPLNRVSLTEGVCKYRVDSITYLKDEDVYCVSEPNTLSFTLSSGILTGNCAFVSTENVDKELSKPFTFLMDVSMLGVGKLRVY